MMICLLSNSNNSYGLSFWLITFIFSPVFQLKVNNTPLEFDGDLSFLLVDKNPNEWQEFKHPSRSQFLTNHTHLFTSSHLIVRDAPSDFQEDRTYPVSFVPVGQLFIFPPIGLSHIFEKTWQEWKEMETALTSTVLDGPRSSFHQVSC